MRIRRSAQMSNPPVEIGSVVEAGFGLEAWWNSSRTAETVGSADRTARMPSAQALISLAEARAARSGCTGMLKSETASLRHLASFGSVVVWRMAGLRAVVPGPA